MLFTFRCIDSQYFENLVFNLALLSVVLNLCNLYRRRAAVSAVHRITALFQIFD